MRTLPERIIVRDGKGTHGSANAAVFVEAIAAQLSHISAKEAGSLIRLTV
jgi:hypothetical protein